MAEEKRKSKNIDESERHRNVALQLERKFAEASGKLETSLSLVLSLSLIFVLALVLDLVLVLSLSRVLTYTL